jgi:hypothetical protein
LDKSPTRERVLLRHMSLLFPGRSVRGVDTNIPLRFAEAESGVSRR